MTRLDRAIIAGFSAITAYGTLISSAAAERMGCNNFCFHDFHGAPGPVVGAGLPVIVVAGVVVFAVVRLRRKQVLARSGK